MSNFAFLKSEWSDIFESASKAELLAMTDPRTACFYARRTLELAVSWAFKYDGTLKLPYQDNTSALIHEPTFKQVAGDAVFNKAKVIVTLGNRAVQELACGELDQVMVKGKSGYILLSQAGSNAVLALLAKEGGKLGLILLDAKRAAKHIADIV